MGAKHQGEGPECGRSLVGSGDRGRGRAGPAEPVSRPAGPRDFILGFYAEERHALTEGSRGAGAVARCRDGQAHGGIAAFEGGDWVRPKPASGAWSAGVRRRTGVCTHGCV